MPDQVHFMIDLETAGTTDNAAIIAIGCCAFDPANQVMLGELYRTIDITTSMAEGGEVDGKTLQWWMLQNDLARTAAWIGDTDISTACEDLIAFMAGFCVMSDLNRQVWGNGSDFDLVILRNTYRRLGLEEPWLYNSVNCYRTLKKLHQAVRTFEPEIKHHALHDARVQAQHVCNIYKFCESGSEF